MDAFPEEIKTQQSKPQRDTSNSKKVRSSSKQQKPIPTYSVWMVPRKREIERILRK